MAYCVYTELANLTGSSLAEAVLTQIITFADYEIDAVLRAAGISSANSLDLKAASLNLSIAGVISRQMNDGTLPKRIKVGGMELESEPSQAIAFYRQAAMDILRNVIAGQRSYRNVIRKVNR